MEDLAAVLRQLRRRQARQRKDAQLTYREMAAKTGWSAAILADYFTGKVLPPTDRFDVLVTLLGAQPTEQGPLATARDRVDEHRRAAAAPRRARRGVPVPRQLPTDVSGFAGRRAELSALDTLRGGTGGSVAIATVCGTAGIGKTTLAVHWAHHAADRFPDGQLYVNLRGFDPGGSALDPAEALRGFLDALDPTAPPAPADLSAQAARYRSLLAERRVLILLDNARDPDQVRPLLPGTGGCLVLVTSRHRLSSLVAVEGARPLALDTLTDADAWHLLARRLGTERVSAEPRAVDTIVARCAGLPLALSVVAARAATHTGFELAAVAEELGAPGPLDGFAGDDPATNLRTVFSWSYAALARDSAQLFRFLGLAPVPHVDAAAAASLAGITVAAAQPLLADLARVHLVTEPRPLRYGFHDLLRSYATELASTLDQPARREAALGRLLDHYIATALAARSHVAPDHAPDPPTPDRSGPVGDFVDREHAVDWLAAEEATLVSAVERAAAHGLDTHAFDLARTLWHYFDLRGNWDSWLATLRIALAAAERIGDLSLRARAHRSFALVHVRLRRYEDSLDHLRQAFDLYGALGDLDGQANAMLSLAELRARLGSYEEALHHAYEGLDLYQRTGHYAGQARALNIAGWCHGRLGHAEKAIPACRQALSLQQEIGDRVSEADTWDSLGDVYHRLSQYEAAAGCYERAVTLCRECRDRLGEGEALAHLGDAYDASGQHEAARNAWQRALPLLDEVDRTYANEVQRKVEAGEP